MRKLQHPIKDGLSRGWKISGGALAKTPEKITCDVKGRWSLGSGGMGCPTNAKQSMLVTILPAALDKGAQMLVQTRAERFELANGRISALLCSFQASNTASDQQIRAQAASKIIAKHYVLAGGAINSPALPLSKSKA